MPSQVLELYDSNAQFLVSGSLLSSRKPHGHTMHLMLSQKNAHSMAKRELRKAQRGIRMECQWASADPEVGRGSGEGRSQVGEQEDSLRILVC